LIDRLVILNLLTKLSIPRDLLLHRTIAIPRDASPLNNRQYEIVSVQVDLPRNMQKCDFLLEARGKNRKSATPVIDMHFRLVIKEIINPESWGILQRSVDGVAV
jgi:hypothetical protein